MPDICHDHHKFSNWSAKISLYTQCKSLHTVLSRGPSQKSYSIIITTYENCRRLYWMWPGPRVREQRRSGRKWRGLIIPLFSGPTEQLPIPWLFPPLKLFCKGVGVRDWHFSFETSRFRNFCQIFEGFGFDFGKFGLGKKSQFRFRKFGLGKKSWFRKIWFRKKVS